MSSPCIFDDVKTDVKLIYHGDYVAIEGHEHDLDDLSEKLRARFELVVTATLGLDLRDDTQAILLNRLLPWEEGSAFVGKRPETY